MFQSVNRSSPVAVYVTTLHMSRTQLVVSCCANEEELLVHVGLVGKLHQTDAVQK